MTCEIHALDLLCKFKTLETKKKMVHLNCIYQLIVLMGMVNFYRTTQKDSKATLAPFGISNGRESRTEVPILHRDNCTERGFTKTQHRATDH